jgi:hypothetical protein
MELAIDGLTEAMIGTVVIREVDRALQGYPVWAHPFAGLEYTRARRLYGQARSDGRILISRQFLGTAALADLEDTVRHEIAHLIVGLGKRHGPQWKRVAASLGAQPRASGRSADAVLHRRISDAPLRLIAVLRDGTELEIKTAHRRHRGYLEYRYNRFGKRYRVAGQWVERFYYRDARRRD